MATIGTYNKAHQPLFEYCIATNGIAPIVLSVRGATSYLDWINGFYNVRPLGGLQLIHSDTVKLIDVAPSGRKVFLNGLGTNTILPPPELWKHPETTSSVSSDISVSLNESSRIEMRTLYEGGVSRGYVSLPRINTKSWAKAMVNLSLEPQGDETLESLISSFNGSGYSAKSISDDDYNVSIEIPLDLFIQGSTDEKILFDFNEYSGSEAFKANAPKVRALVKKVDFETTSYSTVIIIR